jgi:hypothetical protein
MFEPPFSFKARLIEFNGIWVLPKNPLKSWAAEGYYSKLVV